MSDGTLIRPALPADLPATVEIERAADELFVELFDASEWPPPATAEERLYSPGFVLVAELDGGVPERPGLIVGFVQLLEVDGHAHLEQLSVLPSHARRGLGRALVRAALDEASRRGHTHVTLRTYSHVPWNTPFYASCGFSTSEPDTDFLRSLIAVEESLGLFAYGPREQMTAVLG